MINTYTDRGSSLIESSACSREFPLSISIRLGNLTSEGPGTAARLSKKAVGNRCVAIAGSYTPVVLICFVFVIRRDPKGLYNRQRF